MQLGEEDEGYLQWLRVAHPGDRPYCELTLGEVTLDPERVSRSTWKFLVCKGRQKTETVWLTAVRAWNMPVRGCQPTPRLGCSIVIIINSVLTLQVSTAKYPMIVDLAK